MTVILHLHLEFGPLIVDFQGGQEQVYEVATELSATGLAVTVTVDEHVTPEMPTLPCSWLWDEPGQTSAKPHPLDKQNRPETSLTTRTALIWAGPLCFRGR